MQQGDLDQSYTFEVTASTEDNLWHLIRSSDAFTLCGKKARRDLYIDPNPGQEAMERLTGRDIMDIMDCPDCKELARFGGETDD